MLVEHSIALDLPNQGSRFVELIATTADVVKRRAPFVTGLIGMAIAGWRKLDAQILRACRSPSKSSSRVERPVQRAV
jgi:hypothetical protein